MKAIETRAIVLALTPYNDRYTIAHLYSEGYGSIGVLLPKRRGKHHLCFVPLSEIELMGKLRQHRSLVELKEVRVIAPHHRLQLEGVKHSQALFLSELLYRLLTHPEPEPELYEFVSRSMSTLDSLERGVANFYLCFTYKLLAYLGISPMIASEPSEGQWYDLREVCYTLTPRDRSKALAPIEARHLPLFARMEYDNLAAYRYTRQERGRIIDHLLAYCRLHLPPFPELRSLSVLRSASTATLVRSERESKKRPS